MTNPHIDRLRTFIQMDGFVVEREEALAALDALAADLAAAIRHDRRQGELILKWRADAERAEARVAELEAALRKIAKSERVKRPDGPRPAWCHEQSFFWDWLTDQEIARAALAAAPADTEGSGRG